MGLRDWRVEIWRRAMMPLVMGDAEEREPDPRSRANSWTSTVREWTSAFVIDPDLYPLIVGTATMGLVMFLQPNRGTRDLYVVAAQVIPVLLLALALEARVFATRNELPPPPSDPADVLRDVRSATERVDAIRRTATVLRARTDDLGARLKDIEQALNSASLDDVPEEELAKARGVIEGQKAEHAAAEATVLEAERELEKLTAALADQERRVKAVRRWWQLRKGAWWGTRGYYVGVGVGVLAIGEFEALSRIADGSYTRRPDFALAAIGYGFATTLVVAFRKR